MLSPVCNQGKIHSGERLITYLPSQFQVLRLLPQGHNTAADILLLPSLSLHAFPVPFIKIHLSQNNSFSVHTAHIPT